MPSIAAPPAAAVQPAEPQITSVTQARAAVPAWLATALPWLLCIGLTLAVYGSSLHAGIMFDAALDLPRATQRSWLQVLTNAGPSPYYRPLTLLIWKACYEILGRNDLAVLHGLSLACHAICGWLVYQLGRRLLGTSAAVMAAAVFLWFPLSYQVVGFVDSLFHSLAALWVLAAVVMYWDAIKLPSPAAAGEGTGEATRWGRVAWHSSRRRIAAALAWGALALLTHESAAALLTPAVLGIELLRRHKLSLWPAAFAIETAAFFGIWLAVPRWPSTPKLDWPSLQLNAAYFFQSLAYPITMLLGHAPRWPFGDVGEVLAVTAATLLALLALAAWRNRLAVAGFGLLWFAAAVALPTALLPWPNYVIDAPRLAYTASAGIALLWAAALAPRVRVSGLGSHVSGPESRAAGPQSRDLGLGFHVSGLAVRLSGVGWWPSVAGALGSLALLAMLAESFAFLGIRERLLDEGASVVSQIVETAVQPGPEAGRTYVNIPAFLGPKDPDFLLGHSGVTMLPDYFGLDLEVAAATGQRLPIQSISYDDLAKPWDEAYGMQGQHASLEQASAAVSKGGGVYVTRFAPGNLRLEYVGHVEPAPGSSAPRARFGDWAELDQATASVEGNSLAVHLAWLTLAKAPGDYTVFVHVAGSDPRPLVQSDGYPVAGLVPPRDWPANSEVDDVRYLTLPPQAANRPLRVLIGLYDRAAPTRRAPATDAGGQRLPDDALAIPVR